MLVSHQDRVLWGEDHVIVFSSVTVSPSNWLKAINIEYLDEEKALHKILVSVS